MPPASGLGSQIGISTETTPGTFVAPTTFNKLISESLALKKDAVSVVGLAAGMAAQDDSLEVETTRHVEGDVTLVPLTVGLGKWLNLLAPGTIAPSGAGAAKTYAFPVGADVPDAKAASLQVGVPGTDGVVRAKSIPGAVISSITFAMAAAGTLTMTINVWGKDMLTTETLAVATYPAGSETFSFLQSQLQIDGAAVGSCVRSYSITFTFPKASDRYCLNGTGTALNPITNGLIGVTGNYELEFSGGWAQFNAFKDATRRSLSVTNLAKTDIEAGTKGALNITIPKFKVVDDGTPMVAGPDLVTTTVSFKALTSPGSPLATITYVTTDTAL
jgi:hypothetical protein